MKRSRKRKGGSDLPAKKPSWYAQDVHIIGEHGSFEWDARKASFNLGKHGVTFQEALPVFRDEFAITVEDKSSEPNEQRFVAIGTGVKGRVLVVVYTYRTEKIRLISARVAERQERRIYEDKR